MNRAANLLDRFTELAYVTSDLEQALAYFRQTCGLPEWMETGVVPIDLGEGRTAQLKIAVAFAGNTLIEIIQPLGGEAEWFRAVLPGDGRFAIRPHHLGFTAASLPALDEIQSKLGKMHTIPFHGAFGSGSRYFFADARQRLGLWLEYIHFGTEFENLIPSNRTWPIGEPAGKLANVYQLAWVTNDYDRALSILHHDYGIERFLETGLVETDLGGGRMARLKVAMAYVDGTQMELIAPIDGFIDTHRLGLPEDDSFTVAFHHIALACPDRAALDKQRALIERQGGKIAIEGEFGQSAYFYEDARDLIGHHIEYTYIEPEFDALIPRN